jgi:hypothetical protein
MKNLGAPRINYAVNVFDFEILCCPKFKTYKTSIAASKGSTIMEWVTLWLQKLAAQITENQRSDF